MARVLIIEDDSEIREDLAEILSEEGFQVATAANGADGLRQLRQEPCCVVLLDLMMPVLDGWGFRAQQTKDPTIAAVPVLVVSGASDVPQRARALNAAGYLRKPFGLDELVKAVGPFCRPSSG
jgi:DNA-binding response OmpR family regulator